MAKGKSPSKKRYSELERRTAMAAYAFTSGNEEQTTALLASQEVPLDIPFNTIKSWVQRHKDDYRTIRSEIDEHTRSMFADTHRRVGMQYAEIEEIGLLDLKREFQEGNLTGKDLANALKNLAIAGAVHTDKSERLADRPTIVVEHDITDIKKALQRGGIEFAEPINVDAIEVDVLPAG